jgi:hypothetical protein
MPSVITTKDTDKFRPGKSKSSPFSQSDLHRALLQWQSVLQTWLKESEKRNNQKLSGKFLNSTFKMSCGYLTMAMARSESQIIK